MEQMVLLDVDGGLATVTLNRPARMNAMNLEMADRLLDALSAVAEDPAVRVLVLTGAGRAFCVGADLDELDPGSAGPSTLEGRISDVRRVVRTAQLLHDMRAVTIAAINGACAGAGLSWAAACDLRFAAGDARFNTAFLSAGASGDYGATWTLTRLLGSARARDLLLLAERFDAAEAMRIGLVTKVFDADGLMAEVAGVVQQLLGRSPSALAAMKCNLNDAERLSFHEALESETRRLMECMLDGDMLELVRARREGRPPAFHR